MHRKILALFLIVSWVFLSAIDLLEDLDLGACAKISTTEPSGFPGLGRTANVANNTVENGSRCFVVADTGLVMPLVQANAGCQASAREASAPKKKLAIYKLYSAFLI